MPDYLISFIFKANDTDKATADDIARQMDEAAKLSMSYHADDPSDVDTHYLGSVVRKIK